MTFVEVASSAYQRRNGARLHGSPRRQQGVVLYVALIMLILLALIGVVGMQVSGLQERMSSNYRAASLAFQATEQAAKLRECGVDDLVNRTTTAGCSAAELSTEPCSALFDPMAKVEAQALSGDSWVNIRAIGPCISGNASLAMGGPANEDPNPVYQITAYFNDSDADAAIDTVFRP